MQQWGFVFGSRLKYTVPYSKCSTTFSNQVMLPLRINIILYFRKTDKKRKQQAEATTTGVNTCVFLFFSQHEERGVLMVDRNSAPGRTLRCICPSQHFYWHLEEFYKPSLNSSIVSTLAFIEASLHHYPTGQSIIGLRAQ